MSLYENVRDRLTPKSMKRGSAEADDDQKLLDEIRERYTYAMDEWREIRADAKEDMRYVSGDPWQPADRKQREDAGRPCLSLDELHQYYNQLINDVRANPRAPKFDPVGNGADDKTARFYGDKWREIEYRSQAQIAYTTAFQNAVHQGYGWVKLATKWKPKDFVQDLWIEDVPNPDLIVGDPDALRPSSSDQKFLFNLRSLSVKEFKREFPDAKVTSFTPEIIAQAPAWVSAERVQIAEYWTVEPETKTVYQVQLPDGTTRGFYEDELADMPEGVQVINQREEEVPSVCMYLTNGVEILTKPGQTEKKVRWAGKFIPYVSCFGMVIYVDEGSGPKRKILSMTRLARDPYMLYCYYRTSQAELVGMTPKVPYFVRRGSLKPDQLQNLQKSLHEPIAVIEVENFVDGLPGERPEFPMRNPFEPFIQNLEIGAESARRAIQAAMGLSPLPTTAQRQNQKSGIALQQIESTSQRGSFHFIDHYDEMLQQLGVMGEDLLDKVYDTAREVGVRDAKGNAKSIRINDPRAQGPDDLPSTKGDHTVTVTTGPAFESQRAEGAAFTDTLVSNLQMIAATAGPKPAAAMLGLAIKLKNLGELGDEMAKIVTPPEFSEEGQQSQIPPQVMQQMQQMAEENQQLKQILQSKQAEAQAKAQAEMQKVQLQEQAENQRAQIEAAVRMEVARLNAQNALTIAAMSAKSKADEMLVGHQVARDEQLIGNDHDLMVQQIDHEHEAAMAQLSHAQGMEAAAQNAAMQPDADGDGM